MAVNSLEAMARRKAVDVGKAKVVGERKYEMRRTRRGNDSAAGTTCRQTVGQEQRHTK